MDFKNIEKKWQDKWDEAKCFEASKNIIDKEILKIIVVPKRIVSIVVR